MERVKTFVYGILAGLSIALGGTVFLSVENRVLGAALFTVGLFTVCVFGLNLFTGKVCYVFQRDKRYALDLILIWLGNFCGTFLAALCERRTRIGPALSEKAAALCETKLSDGLFSIFILAVFCNILIYIGVEGFRTISFGAGKCLALFFGVMVFILCGFEHCVANMYYFSVAGLWSPRAFGYLLVMTLGNAVGGVLLPLCSAWKEKGADPPAQG